jgi:hypothetical protein
MTSNARRVAPFAAFAACLLLAGCSGTKPAPTFETDDADETAVSLIPDPQVFPGNGWKIVATNDFGDEGDDKTADPKLGDECDEQLDDSLTPILALEARYEGRAQKEFELSEAGRPADFPLRVDVQAYVYGDRKTVREEIALLSAALEEVEFADCTASSLEQELSSPDEEGNSVAFDVLRSAASGRAPRNGAGWAFTGKLRATGEDHIRVEEYQWGIGNATIYVSIVGDSNDVTSEFVQTLLARLDGAALVAGNR